MATFAISRSPSGYTASVDGQDLGREVDAAAFRPVTVGKEVTGLAKTFGEAVNDANSNVRDVTPAVAPNNYATTKPQGLGV